ncbi:MAG: DUF4139 domain-containing protein [Myxococcales bacterium]|nr:DUF4139 domain-containing protein [Myxococcales bacterium]
MRGDPRRRYLRAVVFPAGLRLLHRGGYRHPDERSQELRQHLLEQRLEAGDVERGRTEDRARDVEGAGRRVHGGRRGEPRDRPALHPLARGRDPGPRREDRTGDLPRREHGKHRNKLRRLRLPASAVQTRRGALHRGDLHVAKSIARPGPPCDGPAVTLECPSAIAAVEVCARGALITRLIELPSSLPDGEVDLVVAGVTPLVEAGSIRAAVTGGARRVISVQAALAVTGIPARPGRSTLQVRALDGRIARLDAERAALLARTERLRDLRLAPSLATWRRDPVDARIEDALAVSALIADLVSEADGRLVTLEEQLADLAHERAAAALADAQATSAERMGSGHPTRRITIRLAGDGQPERLELSYAVPAARWWPVYTLRLTDGGRHAEWWLEALVAHRTGEDWTGVRLVLSTADLIHDARLPELPSLRLGRRQPPSLRGYRPAPAGLDRMFDGHDRAFPALSPSSTAAPIDQGGGGFVGASYDDLEVDEVLAEGESPAPTRPAPTPAPAPARFRTTLLTEAPAAAAAAMKKKGGPFGGRVAKPLAAPPAPPLEGALWADETTPDRFDLPIEPADAWRDFDSLTLAAPGDPRRGRLVHESDGASAFAAYQAIDRIESLSPMGDARDPLTSRGLFDHRYDASGRCEIPSDGVAHRLILATAPSVPTLRWRTAPRGAPEVYREAELQNPFDAPLLAGPVDVFVEGSLLLTTAIDGIDRGGTLRVGMGVEERIRVARNVRVVEESAGLLGGSTLVEHSVTIDLTSSLGRPSEVEVLERAPVSDEKAVEIEVLTLPEAEDYDQADRGAPVRRGLRWRVALPAGGKARVELQYRITLPSRSELVGGNRRE